MGSNLKRIIQGLFWSLLAVSIIALVIYETWDLRAGPRIEVSYPRDGELIVRPLIEVQGKVENSTAVFLNGRKIFVTERGEFNEKLLLMPGYNIMTISAEDRQRRRKEKSIEVMFDDSGAPDSL